MCIALLAVCFVFLVPYLAHGQYSERVNGGIDSIANVGFEEAKDITRRLHAFVPDGSYNAKIDSALVPQFERWEAGESIPSSKLPLFQAWVYHRMNNTGKTIEKAALSLTRTNCSLKDSISGLNFLWINYAKLSDTKRSFHYHELYTQLMSKAGRLPQHFHPEDNLQELYGMLGLHERTLYYAKRRHAREFGRDPKGASSASAFNNLGVFCQRAGELDSALFYYEKAYQAMLHQIDEEHLPEEHQMYQFQYFILGNIGDVYLAMGQPTKAIPLLLDDLNRSQSAYLESDRANVNINLARCYLLLEDAESAEPHLTAAWNFFDRQNNPDMKMSSLKLIAEYHYLRGEFEGYHRSTKSWTLLQDSLLEAEKNQQLSALLTARELDQKVELLAVQDAQIANDAVEKKDLRDQRNWIIAISVVIALLLGLGVLWLRSEKKQKAFIHKVLGEKEVLLREVHHRVKNNLQIVSGLLQIQRDKVEEPEARQVLKEAEQRVRTMAMVGDKLHGKNMESQVNFQKYLEDLLANLAMTYANPRVPVEVKLNCPEIHLDINTSIPLGLIVNELISNAYKHAFQGRDSGIIQVSMEMDINAGYRIIVKDNGVGIQKDLDNLADKHLGVSLIQGLASQLKGTMESSSDEEGTTFRVTFRESRKRTPQA